MPQMRLVMKWASRGSFPFRKTLKPRKIDDVLWHSATWRFAKSILVWMPRLPTMRVIGSHDISTSLPLLLDWTGTARVAVVMQVLRVKDGAVWFARVFGACCRSRW